MRYARIFLLNCQNVLEQRSRSFVWFLVSLLAPTLFLLFWKGAASAKPGGWTLPYFTSYYFLLIIAGSLLIAHIEEDVAFEDIQQGHIIQYLLRPLSYFWFKCIEETPYRLLQGGFGILVFTGFFLFFGEIVALSKDPIVLLAGFFSVILAYFISFTFKMIVGLSAFWFTDAVGLQQMVHIFLFLFAGFIMPIALMPTWLKTMAFITPFPYMLYTPIIIFQGTLSEFEIVRQMVVQCFWLLVLLILYKQIWKKGIQMFSGIGQ
jgi:ABC-2 type transport system permease protein